MATDHGVALPQPVVTTSVVLGDTVNKIVLTDVIKVTATDPHKPNGYARWNKYGLIKPKEVYKITGVANGSFSELFKQLWTKPSTEAAAAPDPLSFEYLRWTQRAPAYGDKLEIGRVRYVEEDEEYVRVGRVVAISKDSESSETACDLRECDTDGLQVRNYPPESMADAAKALFAKATFSLEAMGQM